MPTLGFLKKLRTKEAPDPRDPASSTADRSQGNTPLTPTTSRGFEALTPSTTNQTDKSLTTQLSNISQTKTTAAATTGEQSSMTQGATPQQQLYAASPHTVGTPVAVPAEQQNLPSIGNLINPPQNDGTTQSIPTQVTANTSAVAANGSAATTQKEMQQPQQTQARTTKGKYTLSDFEILRTLGTGSFGRVHLVQSKHNQRYYAVKVLKKVQVVKMKQIEHTNDERRMLQEVKHPFLITLWGTFSDAKNLYMVMDFVEGGELFSLLRKSQVCSIFPLLGIITYATIAISKSRSKILCCRGHTCA
jgi:protein kinase A